MDWTSMDIFLTKVLWFFEILVKCLWDVAANTVVIDSDQFQVKKLVIDLVDLIHIHDPDSEDSNHR